MLNLFLAFLLVFAPQNLVKGPTSTSGPTIRSQGGGGAIQIIQPASPNTAVPASCSGGSATTAQACSFASLPVVGHTIFVFCTATGNETWTVVTDNQTGNTYNNVAGATGNNGTTNGVGLWWANVSGSTGTFTVTCHSNNSQFTTVYPLEASNIATSSPVDGTAVNAGGSGTAMSPGGIATSNANDLLLGVCSNDGGTTVTFTPNTTTPNNFAVEYQQTNSSSFYAGALVAQIVSSTNTYTASVVDSATGNWLCGAAAFKQ